MKIGVPKELKDHEYRVGMTPASVLELTGRGHQVVVERGAGGIIAGCTEIELLVAADDVSVPYFPTTRLHAEAAVAPEPNWARDLPLAAAMGTGLAFLCVGALWVIGL